MNRIGIGIILASISIITLLKLLSETLEGKKKTLTLLRNSFTDHDQRQERHQYVRGSNDQSSLRTEQVEGSAVEQEDRADCTMVPNIISADGRSDGRTICE